jgi:hypothetical protein
MVIYIEMNRIEFNKKQQAFIKKFEDKYARHKSSPVQPQVGHIYIFNYPRAKVAKYWDAYPLSLIIDTDSKYLLGLSLHYLPPQIRKYFIQKVLVKNWALLKKGKPAYVPYHEIKSANNLWYKEGMAIIRKYIRSRIRGKFTEIPYTEWLNIITGAGAQWINITAQQVYRITRKDIDKYYTKAEIIRKEQKKRQKELKKKVVKKPELKPYKSYVKRRIKQQKNVIKKRIKRK